MVFNPVGVRGEGEEIVLINPSVSRYSKKIVPFDEGCLSFPGITANLQRPESVKIDARDVTGARFTVNLSGLPARVFQHEFDHLQVRPTFLVRLLICRLQDTKRPMLIEGLADRKQTRIPLFGQNVTKF